MRIYPSNRIREWDAQTLKEQGISSFQLMQRAAFTCFSWLRKHLPKSANISVCCGPGNNGGDGLLIAAYLHQYGYRVHVFATGAPTSEENTLALAYCKAQGLSPGNLEKLIDVNADCIIDALFGHGMLRPLTGDYASLVVRINELKAEKISIDIPSGMPSEAQKTQFTDFIRADLVLSFQQPKLSFFLDEYGGSIKEWKVLDIGLSGHINAPEAPIFVDAGVIAALFQNKIRFSHKGSYGSALLVGGSGNYPGAISLATLGCLLSGVGKTFVATSSEARAACLVQAPEAIYLPGENLDSLTKEIEKQSFACIGVGPGLGQNEETIRYLQALFKGKSNWVIDADALNLIASGKVPLPNGLKVITPHPGEFDRLTRPHHTSADRWLTAKEWSVAQDCIVVLKGAYTSIFFPDGRHVINSTGNPGMAKGGSGDVLCGWLAGYIGRGYPVYDGVLIAVYLHGLAADIAVKEISLEALKARDIIHFGERVAKKWEN